MPPDTIRPSGKFSFGEIQAKGPTKLECPNIIFDIVYFFFSSSGSRVQNLTVLSLDDVAMPASPHIHTDYRFLSIRDAIASVNQRVNLMGMVVEFGIPKKSKGTDCFCSLKIIDESYQSPGLLVNMFAENMEKLPQVKSAGDIVHLSHVVMKSHNGEMYALFNKKFSSFGLFDGKCSKDFIPYQVSPKFHFRDDDKEFLTNLRTWLLDFQVDAGTSESLLSLKEIKEGKRFDLVCKILHVCEASKDDWMVFVWDGTDTPPLHIQAKRQDEMEHPLPLNLDPLPLSRDILCTFPSVGTVFRVMVDQSDQKLGLHLLRTGRWVKFINIICQDRFGLWHGVVMPFTKLRFLPNEDNTIIKRQRFHDERVSSERDRMPLSSFPRPSCITETDYEHIPFATLMDILTYSKVTAKFKSVVRIVSSFPWRVEDFHSPIRIYRIRLTLEDPTARIHAFLYSKDGEKFFGGFPPVDVMTGKWNKLLGVQETDNGKAIEDAPRNPPWVQCCIKSYYLDENDIWGSRRYRIFGTRLVT